MAPAATLWTGPNITYTQFDPNPTDVIIPGAVALDRGVNGPLFNSAAGETFPNGTTSPVDTMWAFGDISDFASLNYQTLATIRNNSLGDFASVILNKPMVVHLLNEDIYLSLEFTAWGQHFAGGFSYIRSTAPAATPPTVNITSPANNASFLAPANVTITASASDSSATVTNVSFFKGVTLIGATSPPGFSITASNLTAGSYALTAVATAGGLSTTSAVVNITVANPTGIILSSPRISNNQFIFSYNASPGSNYIVQTSSTLSNWLTLSTNIASGSVVSVTNPVGAGAVFYRIGQLP